MLRNIMHLPQSTAIPALHISIWATPNQSPIGQADINQKFHLKIAFNFKHIQISLIWPYIKVYIKPLWAHSLVPLDSTYASPGPQRKMHALDFNSKVLIRLPTYFTCCSDYSFGVKSISNYSLEHIYKMFMSFVDPCLWHSETCAEESISDGKPYKIHFISFPEKIYRLII